MYIYKQKTFYYTTNSNNLTKDLAKVLLLTKLFFLFKILTRLVVLILK